MGLCELFRIKRDYEQIMKDDGHELFEESLLIDYLIIEISFYLFK